MNNKNKFIEKIEDDYNSGKISFSEISELRENYEGSNDEEKLSISKKYEKHGYKQIGKKIPIWAYVVMVILVWIIGVAEGPPIAYLFVALVPWIAKKIT